ncbi:MAG TPA: NAD-dependent epimerase/dehydratase family protein [Aggregatilineales bacterium]|nr:NAD-dependent epimerase/dehydratase family protein [Aggregatilineales bacterium]
MRKAFITGASGFIGSALVRRLLYMGVEVRAACRTPSKGAKLADLGAEVVAGDVLDGESLSLHMRGCDVVFHLAAVMGNSIESYTTNVGGTVNVVRAAETAGVERLIHVSSVAVYGFDADGDITEATPHAPSPNDHYMTSKSAGESIMWTYTRQIGLPAVSIRPAFVYGPGSFTWSLMLYRAAQRRFPFVDGGNGHAHPIFVDDVVDLMVTTATHPAAPGNAFHAAPDPATTWREFASYYMRMADHRAAFTVPVKLVEPLGDLLLRATNAIDRPFDLNGALRFIGHHGTYKMTRARELLDWTPHIGLEQGMTLTEPWLRNKAG